LSKETFIQDIQMALEHNRPFAAAKMGPSAQHVLYYHLLLDRNARGDIIKKFENELDFQCLKQLGIFPADRGFYRQYNDFYVEHMRQLDWLGVWMNPEELEVLRYYHLENKFIWFPDQEPDRSIPSNETQCYLPYFRNKKILIICPFAELLKEQASKETFEGVWRKTGKKWFYPRSVDALEFPYGFAAETQATYRTALDLFDHIARQIDKTDFDVALIAAAGLNIPIASYVKKIGKVSIDLGGHLQVVFGVLGARWKAFENFVDNYVTDSWVSMPAKYMPRKKDVCDNGAYW